MASKESGFKAKKAGMSIVMVLVMVISGLAVLAAPLTVAEDYAGGPYGGIVRVALKSQPSSLNPLNDTLDESAEQMFLPSRRFTMEVDDDVFSGVARLVLVATLEDNRKVRWTRPFIINKSLPQRPLVQIAFFVIFVISPRIVLSPTSKDLLGEN